MSQLKQVLLQTLPAYITRFQHIKAHHHYKTFAPIPLISVISGIPNQIVLIHQTSVIDPIQGPLFRGHNLKEVQAILPKPHDSLFPSVEAVFWLLLTGLRPSKDELASLIQDINSRARLSDDTINFMNNLPETIPVMSQLSMGLLYLQKDSKFLKGLANTKKEDYWLLTLEDALDMLARIPLIFTLIYHKLNKTELILNDVSDDSDWCSRLAKGLRLKDPLSTEFLRLFSLMHIDFAGGNVSSHTTKAVSSTLSDPYLAYSAGINGLAGPLHGTANRDVLLWIMELYSKIEKSSYLGLTDENKVVESIKRFYKETVDSGKTIPGFGHSILKGIDLRFLMFKEWTDSNEDIKKDPLVKLMNKCSEIISKLLEKKKIKNPWPNVDLHSGVLLNYFGIQNTELYPGCFAIARSFGCMANIILERALKLPIEYPGSIDLDGIERIIKK